MTIAGYHTHADDRPNELPVIRREILSRAETLRRELER
jgi:hypothetical protein